MITLYDKQFQFSLGLHYHTNIDQCTYMENIKNDQQKLNRTCLTHKNQ